MGCYKGGPGQPAALEENVASLQTALILSSARCLGQLEQELDRMVDALMPQPDRTSAVQMAEEGEGVLVAEGVGKWC